MKIKTSSISAALVLLAGVSWGVISIFVRTLASNGITSSQISAVRSIGAALIIGLPILVANPKKVRIRLKDIWCFVGTGIVSIACFNLCYFAAMQRMSVGLAVILLYTSPAFVTLMSCVCFKEKLTRAKVISITMVLVGCVMVCGVGEKCSVTWTGVILGLGSGFFYALYSIFGRYAQQRGYDALTITFWTFICSSVGLCGIMSWGPFVSIVAGQPFLLWFLAGLIVIATILPYFTYTLGMKGLELSAASVIVAVEPVTATIVGFIAFKEKMTLVSLCGMLLVLGAIVILGRKSENTQ